MSPFRNVLALLCACLVAGCYDTRSEHPIGSTGSFAPDQALAGIWKDDLWRQDLNETIHIFQSRDDELTALWIKAEPGKTGSFDEHHISTAKLGNNRFINVDDTPDTADGKAPARYRPMLYTLRNEGHTLTLYTIDDEKTAKAIEAGAIKGIVEKREDKNSEGKPTTSYDKVLITAEPAELDAFMAKPEAADLFEVYMVFKKIE